MIKWTRRAVGLLLMLGLFARLLWGARQLSTTADEPSHITSGYVALACGRVGLWTVPLRGHPLGVDSWLALPLWIAQPDMPLDSTTGWQTDYAAFLDGFWASLATQEQTVFAARVQAMFLTLLLAAVVWRWGRDVRPQPDSYSAPAGGPWAGLLALGVLAFDPTLIAHGRLATNDVGVTALGTCRTPAAMSWQKLSANSQRFLTEFSAKRGILESAVKVRLSSSRRRRNRVRGTCQTGAIARCAQSAPIRQGANMKKHWKLYSGLGGVTLVLAVLGVWLFGGTAVASASEAPRSVWAADDLQALTQSTTGPGLLGDGYLAHGGWGGRGGFMFPRPGDGTIDYQQLLADALGITVDELETAFAEARAAAIEQAVEEGLITREQADEMLVWGDLGGRGFGQRTKGPRGFGGPMGRGFKGVSDSAIDGNALLAEALGITVEALDAARETANQAAIDQALEEGLITQEQIDQMQACKEQMQAHQEQMQARKDVQSTLDRNTLLADALGMTVEELQAALDEDKSLSTLMSEKGLDAATVRENLQAAYQAAIAQAVEDGVITQEQADAMKDGTGWGFGPRGFAPRGFGREGMPMPEDLTGKGGFRGRGGFGGRGPWNPDTDETSGTGLRRPGRTLQDANAL